MAAEQRPARAASELPSAPATAMRRTYRRRRLGALGVVVLLVITIGSAAGAGHRAAVHRARPRPVLRPIPPSAAATQRLQDQAVQRVLGYTSYIARGSARHREVALTFDDGPGPFTPQVLDVLRRHRVPATFFVVGRSLVDFGSALPAEIAQHYVIGDHTQDHMLLTVLSRHDQARQIYDQAADVRSYEAPFPRLFRPPYGGFNATTLALLHRFGMLMVLWSVDTHDYMSPGVDTIVQRALAGAVPGAIILMHDAGGPREQTIAALPRIIAGLRARHLRPVTVPRLLVDDPPDPAQPPPHSLAGGG
jgi:peptidoglycan/xylan/chitin deacetylase (PgdA/CDA1 family)